MFLEIRFGVMTMLSAMPRAMLIATPWNNRLKDPQLVQDQRDPSQITPTLALPFRVDILRARMVDECRKCFDTGRNTGVCSRAWDGQPIQPWLRSREQLCVKPHANPT
jgi:hypothetical protein